MGDGPLDAPRQAHARLRCSPLSRVQGAGCRVQGVGGGGWGVWSEGFGVGCRVWGVGGVGCRVWGEGLGVGCRVWGVEGVGCRVWGVGGEGWWVLGRSTSTCSSQVLP